MKEPPCLLEIDVKKLKQDKKKEGGIQYKVLFFLLSHVSHSPEMQSRSRICAKHRKPLQSSPVH